MTLATILAIIFGALGLCLFVLAIGTASIHAEADESEKAREFCR